MDDQKMLDLLENSSQENKTWIAMGILVDLLSQLPDHFNTRVRNKEKRPVRIFYV